MYQGIEIDILFKQEGPGCTDGSNSLCSVHPCLHAIKNMVEMYSYQVLELVPLGVFILIV